MIVRTLYVPEDSQRYLTEGKEYETVFHHTLDIFDIVGDHGALVTICTAYCEHLNGEAWEVLT